MATNALDIVSLATMKSELRIELVETSHDTLLTGLIANAVSFVSRPLRVPLLDRAEGFRCSRPSDSATPIVLPTDGVRSVGSIRYWTATGSLRESPNGTIAVGTLGRLVARFGFDIYPPADGWPVVLDNSLIEIVVTRGMDTPAALRSAVVLCVRQLYDGYREIRPTEAFDAMIAPWRDHGSLTVAGFDPTGIMIPEVPIDPVISDHSRYFGWSDDRTIETADFGAAATSNSNVGNLPTRTTNGHVWIAVPESAGYPRGYRLLGGQRVLTIPQLAGTRDDTNGAPHLVGVTTRLQAPTLSGGRIELVY